MIFWTKSADIRLCFLKAPELQAEFSWLCHSLLKQSTLWPLCPLISGELHIPDYATVPDPTKPR